MVEVISLVFETIEYDALDSLNHALKCHVSIAMAIDHDQNLNVVAFLMHPILMCEIRRFSSRGGHTLVYCVVEHRY